jgi:uncharacterized protein
MRIGITGASGFIGRVLGPLAQQAGHQVIAYTRSPAKARMPWATEVRELKAESDLPMDATGLDCLIHLCGEPILGLWTAKKKKLIWDSRVDLTRRVIRCIAAAERRPLSVICGSAVGFYGDRGEEWLKEEASPGNDFLAKLCVAWEAEAAKLQQLGLRVCTVRTGMVLGNEGGGYPMLKKVFRWAMGGPLGNGRQFVPWITVQDMARMFLWLAENPKAQGAFNGCAPEPVTNAEFTKKLAKSLGCPAFMPAPAFAMRLMLRELADVLLGSQRATPHAILKQGFSFDHPTLEAGLAHLVSSSK